MEYQKIINLIDDTSNQLSKFRTKNWIVKGCTKRFAMNCVIQNKTFQSKFSLTLMNL